MSPLLLTSLESLRPSFFSFSEANLRLLRLQVFLPKGTSEETRKLVANSLESEAKSGPLALPPGECWRGTLPIIWNCSALRFLIKPIGLASCADPTRFDPSSIWGEATETIFRLVVFGSDGDKWQRFESIARSAGSLIRKLGRLLWDEPDSLIAWLSFIGDLAKMGDPKCPIASNDVLIPLEWILDEVPITTRKVLDAPLPMASAWAIDTTLAHVDLLASMTPQPIEPSAVASGRTAAARPAEENQPAASPAAPPREDEQAATADPIAAGGRPIRLTGPQEEGLCRVISEHFDLPELKILIRFRLDTDLDEITTGTDKRTVIFCLIEWSKRHGRVEDLIRAVQGERPKSQTSNPSRRRCFLSITRPRFNIPHHFHLDGRTAARRATSASGLVSLTQPPQS